LFLDTFMRFGPPYVHQITEHGWVPFENKFLDKSRLQVRCLLVAKTSKQRLCGSSGPSAAAATRGPGLSIDMQMGCMASRCRLHRVMQHIPLDLQQCVNATPFACRTPWEQTQQDPYPCIFNTFFSVRQLASRTS
jgi:hypothetical protein